MRSDTCASCKFFYKDPGRVTTYPSPDSMPQNNHLFYWECRRFPQWVMRRSGDWCGEYKTNGTRDFNFSPMDLTVGG
jgi:hypothetical protein